MMKANGVFLRRHLMCAYETSAYVHVVMVRLVVYGVKG